MTTDRINQDLPVDAGKLWQRDLEARPQRLDEVAPWSGPPTKVGQAACCLVEGQ